MNNRITLNKKELKEVIRQETMLYGKKSFLRRIAHFFVRSDYYNKIKFHIHLRKYEFYLAKRNSIFAYYHKFHKDRIGRKFGWEIPPFVCGKCFRLCHKNIVINENSVIGEYAVFRGNNCIGRKDSSPQGSICPTIGNHVDFGYGCIIIGKVNIGNNCKIGAGSVVVKSYPNDSVIVGNPSHTI